MSVYKWNEMENEALTDLISRRYFSGQSMTLARFSLKKGSIVPAHSHENEQFSTVLSGATRFIMDGKEIIITAGETLVIKPFSVHSAEAIEDTDILDVFCPVRSDWESGADSYLRGKSDGNS
jgi:quercetin dioxygenase-like cupin family protein